MEIQLLTKTIMEAADKRGYNTLVGDCARGTAQPVELPMLCLAHPVLRAKEGRRRGVVAYRIEMVLMSQTSRNSDVATSEADKEADLNQLTALYDDALVIIERVDALPEVCGVVCISSTPSKAKLSPSGDMALKVIFDVKLKFRRQR